MALKPYDEYLVGKRIMGLAQEGRVVSLQKGEKENIENLSNKERALRFN